ncbi:M20/M25/M40 family metallo-hydrolase, partial [Actinoallomurus acaciae]
FPGRVAIQPFLSAETERLAAFPHEALGPATMTVTILSGGALQNTVPDEATLIVDRRLVPGETHEDCDRRLAAMLDDLRTARPGMDVAEPEVVVATVPSATAADEPVVGAALAALGDAGRPADRATGFNAGCDMSKLVGVGIPTVICGPGSLSQAHRPDESVPLDELVDAVDVYEGIARRLLACTREG